VLVDTTETTEIRAEERHTACGWTPFEGFEAVFPEWTMVRGTTVYERDPEGDVFYANAGENVRDADAEFVA
jgi:dihydroorotase